MIRNKYLVQIFVIYLRYILGASFVFASVIKIMGHRFTSESGEQQPIHSAWHFFETLYRSGLYWQFLGWGQAIGGLLLMTQRFATLGVLVFFPLILNVFVITLSYEFGGTLLVTTCMLIGTVFLLIWDWPVLKVLVGLNSSSSHQHDLSNQLIWQIVGLLIFTFTFAYRFIVPFYYNPIFWLLGCLVIGLVGFVLSRRRSGLRRSFSS